MSHFTVLVKVKPNEELDELLAPYAEQDYEEKYRAFNDETESLLEDWNEGEHSAFVDPQGKAYSKYDSRFSQRHPDNQWESNYVCPEGWTEQEVPGKDLYESLEVYANDYHGYEPHEIDGVTKYGYFDNPNSKWDWYVIGGRWNGQLGGKNVRPAQWFKDNHTDLETKARADADLFVREYSDALAAGKVEGGVFEKGPRNRALDCGFVQCKNDDEIDRSALPKGTLLKKWPRQIKDGVDRYDVCTPIPDGWAEDHWWLFYPISTYALLGSKEGWCAPGEMGWFGHSSEDAEQLMQFRKSYIDWLLSASDEDEFVLVDCHI